VLSVDRFLSSIAVVIASLALVVSAWQTHITQQHNRLSVRPFLIITPHYEGIGRRNGLYMTNEGMGTGIITDFSVSTHGKTFSGLGAGQWQPFAKEFGIDADCFARGWPLPRTPVRVGQEIPIFTLSDATTPSSTCYIQLFKLFTEKGASFRLRYESLYEEPFESEGDISGNDQDAIELIKRVLDAYR
jgi:hypothetical protein